MGIPRILAFPPYRISCRISLAHAPDIAGHKWGILVISIAVRDCFLDFVVKWRTNKRSNHIICDPKSIAH